MHERVQLIHHLCEASEPPLLLEGWEGNLGGEQSVGVDAVAARTYTP